MAEEGGLEVKHVIAPASEVEHEEHETEEGKAELERTIGQIENEIEHHSEDLKEHEDNLANLTEDRRWAQAEIQRIEAMVLAVPIVPKELLQDLTERVTKLETEAGHKIQEVTELPEIVQEPKKERRSILDRIL